MRTTLTLDPDVAASLRGLQRQTGAQHKALVNEAMRRGLRELAADVAKPARARYRTKPVDPGPPATVGVHSVHDLLAFAEGEDFR